jgi:hypothetical protein
MVNAAKRPMRSSARAKYIPKQKAYAFCVDKVDGTSYQEGSVYRSHTAHSGTNAQGGNHQPARVSISFAR